MKKERIEERNQKIIAIIAQAGEAKTKTDLVYEVAKKYKIAVQSVWRILRENKPEEQQENKN